MNSLVDTIAPMISEDYNDRFKAEYYQLAIRINKLAEMLDKWDKEELNFTPKCEKSLLHSQLDAMQNYLCYLVERAVIENIDIDFNAINKIY